MIPFLSGGGLAGAAHQIIKKYNGSLFVPSPRSCFADVAGTVAAVQDETVACVVDVLGGPVNLTQSTTGYMPILRRGAKNFAPNSTWVAGVVFYNTYGIANCPVQTQGPQYGGYRGGRSTLVTQGATYNNRVQVNMPAMSYGITVTNSFRIRKTPSFTGEYCAFGHNNTTQGLVMFNAYSGAITDHQAGVVASSCVTDTADPSWWFVQVTILLNSVAGYATEIWVTVFYPAYNTTGLFSSGQMSTGGSGYSYEVDAVQCEIGTSASPYIMTVGAPLSSGVGNWWLDGSSLSNTTLNFNTVPFAYTGTQNGYIGVSVNSWGTQGNYQAFYGFGGYDTATSSTNLWILAVEANGCMYTQSYFNASYQGTYATPSPLVPALPQVLSVLVTGTTNILRVNTTDIPSAVIASPPALPPPGYSANCVVAMPLYGYTVMTANMQPAERSVVERYLAYLGSFTI